jgi:hypothetical protein
MDMGSNMASAHSTEQDTLQDMGSNMASAHSTEQDTLNKDYQKMLMK